MSTLDFSALTDDQLVELVRAACAEAVRRGAAVEAATRGAMLDEAEKAEIAHDAARREAERLLREQAEKIARDAADAERAKIAAAEVEAKRAEQEKAWRNKRILGEMTRALFGPGVTLTVWLKDEDHEKRVYIDKQGAYISRKYGSKTDVRVEYYVTGNGRNPAGTIAIAGDATVPSGPLVDEEGRLTKTLVERAARDWNRVKIDCDAAAAAAVPTPIELPAEFVAFQAAREAAAVTRQAAADARAEAAAKERAALEAQREAARVAAAAEQARAVEERQEKLRALLGGTPILLVTDVDARVEPAALEGLSWNTAPAGRVHVLAVRGDDPGRFTLAAVNVDRDGVRLAEMLTPEPIGADAIPELWAAWLDGKAAALLADPAALGELARDTIANQATGGGPDPSRKVLWAGGSTYYHSPAKREAERRRLAGVA